MEANNDFFFTDTHAHLASRRFEEDLDEVVARAQAEDVGRIISISCDLEDSSTNLELSRRFAPVDPAAGVHPLYVHELERDWEGQLRDLAANPEVVAIGEIGLDYFHPPADGSTDEEWRKRQRTVFEAQLQLAIDLDLPVVVHQRESASDVGEVLGNFPSVRAVLHCFTGTPKEAELALSRGHSLSFTGILTFPNAQEVRDVAEIVPPDRIMVETDCPYLAPAPFRGKRCEPAHVRHTTIRLAELRGVSVEEMARQTSGNATLFFRRRNALPVPASDCAAGE